MADVLLVCSDPEHVEHLGALASAAQLSAEVCTSSEAVAGAWRHALAVVVGVEELPRVVNAGLPKRPEVVVYGVLAPMDWQATFELGADAVVTPPGEPGWLGDRVRRAGPSLPAGVVIGVVGCRGGAGGSVLASAIAVAAGRAGHVPFLLDLDPWGCGVEVILGTDRLEGLTWDQISAGAGSIPASSLQSAVQRVDGVAVLGWPDGDAVDLPGGIVGAVIDAARTCSALTVCDLGRGTDPVQQEALTRCDRVLMVVPADVRSVRSARRVMSRLNTQAWEIIVRGPNPGGLLIEDITAALGRPVLAAVGADRSLDQRLERGEPPGGRVRTPLGRAGDGLLREVLR